MENIKFQIHWLTFTLWGTEEYALKLWDLWFKQYLGAVEARGFGGRGFRNRYEGLAGSKIYVRPVSYDSEDKTTQFASFEFPGSACECIPAKEFQILMIVLARFETFRITRMDLAWDGLACSPEDFQMAVVEDRVRSLAKRESLIIRTSPFKDKQNGEQATTTVTFGSRYSGRRIQFYDRRGFTRLELEMKQERADAVARDVLVRQPDEWSSAAIGHLRDYLDVFESQEKQDLVSWWQELVESSPRALLTVSNARDIELNRIISWVDKQVSPALSVLADVVGLEAIEAFIKDGRRKRGAKYRSLLDLVKGKGNNPDE